MKARKAALEADVVVVNHHLFFADVMLRDEGLSELLPACHTVILDEAHQLPDTATLFFGEQVAAGALAELARDAEVAARTGAREVPDLPAAAADLGPAIRKLRLALGEGAGKLAQSTRRAARRLPAGARRAGRPRSTARRPSSACSPSAARTWPPSPAAPASCRRRCAAGATVSPAGRARSNAARTTARPMAPRATTRSAGGGRGPRSRRRLDPLDRRDAAGLPAARVAAVGRGHLLAAGRRTPARAWIFTSATLAVAGDFSLYQRELGLADAATGCWESPFDYATQALLYVPRGLPEPNSREHTEAVVAAALPVLRASGGRAFMLFTSLRALNVARELLAEAIRRRGSALAAAGAGRGREDRAAGALPRGGQRGAAGQREFLGRRRRARRRAVGRRHRQAAVRAARRPAARRAARAPEARRAATRSSTGRCRRRRSA